MTIGEYEKVYAESRVADIDAQIDARNAEVEALQEQRARYATTSKPFKANRKPRATTKD